MSVRLRALATRLGLGLTALRQERPPDLYVTVWFNEGRVEHMRAYPSRVMGRCEDFLAAFSWEDAIGGAGFEGGYRIK